MKKAMVKKNLVTGLSAIAMSIMLVGSYGVTTQASEAAPVVAVKTEQTVSPRSPIIDWRYKGENGKIYKRLYNYTERCWVGDWILCP